MTGNRAAAALVGLALLGPAVAIGATSVVNTSGDSWEHGRLVELEILSAVWVIVCLLGAYTQWRRGS